MTVVDRVVDLEMSIVAFRQEHRRPDQDVLPPEVTEDATSNSEALDVFCVGGERDGRNLVVQNQIDSCLGSGNDLDLFRLRAQVSWLSSPGLAFPMIERHPDRVAVGSFALRMHVEKRLNDISAGGKVVDVGDRISPRRPIVNNGYPGPAVRPAATEVAGDPMGTPPGDRAQ